MDSYQTTVEFCSFLRQLKGLHYFRMFMKANIYANSVEEVLNRIALAIPENDLRNLETLYAAMKNGVKDPSSVVLPYDQESSIIPEPSNQRKPDEIMTDSDEEYADLPPLISESEMGQLKKKKVVCNGDVCMLESDSDEETVEKVETLWKKY